VERDPELQQLIDESAIRKLLASYPRALDRQDHELLASLFHPDAVDDHGAYNGPAAGFVEFMRAAGTPGSHWMHHNGTQIIDMQDEALAFAETYALAFYRPPEADGKTGAQEIFLRVRYLDRVEKRDGQWKIAHRRVVYSPCHILPIAQEFPLVGDIIHEDSYPTDPAYSW
jgi:ketosteroid isomerase-like protein